MLRKKAKPVAEADQEEVKATPVRPRKVVSSSVVGSVRESRVPQDRENRHGPQTGTARKTPHAKMARRRARTVAEREADIWQMWTFGYTQQEIADEYGLSNQRISQIVSGLRDAMPKQSQDEAVQTALESFREQVRTSFKAIQPYVEAGSTDHIRELRALQRHWLIIMGYDPAKPIMVGDADMRVIVEGITNEELQAALR
jgi:transcriptional regulator with XRE-family HTH domain